MGVVHQLTLAPIAAARDFISQRLSLVAAAAVAHWPIAITYQSLRVRHILLLLGLLMLAGQPALLLFLPSLVMALTLEPTTPEAAVLLAEHTPQAALVAVAALVWCFSALLRLALPLLFGAAAVVAVALPDIVTLAVRAQTTALQLAVPALAVAVVAVLVAVVADRPLLAVAAAGASASLASALMGLAGQASAAVAETAPAGLDALSLVRNIAADLGAAMAAAVAAAGSATRALLARAALSASSGPAQRAHSRLLTSEHK